MWQFRVKKLIKRHLMPLSLILFIQCKKSNHYRQMQYNIRTINSIPEIPIFQETNSLDIVIEQYFCILYS